MKKGIIYLATNKVNDKKYIGQTYTALDYRKRRHFKSAFLYESNLTFHQALRKHGKENFTWTTIEDCDVSILDEKEIHWVKYYDSFDNGYNMTEGGGSSRGYHHTKETKEKIRNSMKGKSNLDHWIAKYGEEKGNEVYKEYISKLKKRKGKSRLDGMIEKYGEKEGKRRYDKMIIKMKAGHKGKILSEAHKKAIGKALKKA